MKATYDPEADQLTLTWAEGDAPEWRRARRDLSVLVDYDGEPLGIALHRAAAWHAPQLRHVADATTLDIDFHGASPPAQAEQRQRTANAIAAALIPTAAPTAWQPQLPWDDPLPTAAAYDRAKANRARGICSHCGSVATVRRAPVKSCGWPLATWCGCSPIPAPRPGPPPTADPPPTTIPDRQSPREPAEAFPQTATWTPKANRIATPPTLQSNTTIPARQQEPANRNT